MRNAFASGAVAVALLAGCSTHAPTQEIVTPAQRATLNQSATSDSQSERERQLAFAEHVQQIERTLPAGTRVYVLHSIIVSDPILRLNESFPADSLVTKSDTSITVTPPGRGATVFSPRAAIMQDTAHGEYLFIRPGQLTPEFLKEHATLENVIK